ncbi:hypothetical protein J6590_030220 [Homalodisca vitripennis]|nr:hypothetical protein J6590_030220 [Homalodisca vitripennis]
MADGTSFQTYRTVPREQTVLWDPTCREFRDKNLKNSAWTEIALAMKLSRSEVQTKMRKLIGQFQRESKKGKSGSGAIGSKWYAFDALLFVQDKCAPRQTAEVGLQPQHTEHEVPSLLAMLKKFLMLPSHRNSPDRGSMSSSCRSFNIALPLYTDLALNDGFIQYRFGFICFDRMTHAAATKTTSSTLDISKTEAVAGRGVHKARKILKQQLKTIRQLYFHWENQRLNSKDLRSNPGELHAAIGAALVHSPTTTAIST